MSKEHKLMVDKIDVIIPIDNDEDDSQKIELSCRIIADRVSCKIAYRIIEGTSYLHKRIKVYKNADANNIYELSQFLQKCKNENRMTDNVAAYFKYQVENTCALFGILIENFLRHKRIDEITKEKIEDAVNKDDYKFSHSYFTPRR